MDNLNSDTDFDMEFDHNKERPSTPMALVEAADKANQELLPAKSKDRYMEVYNNYQKWKASKGASSDSERVVTAYISELATSKNKKNENLKPSTLWARYSMLRATLNIYEKTDISKYATLTAFLKRKSDGYVPTKATVFTESEIQRFLDVAADEVWLDVKVVCVFCMFGAGPTHELPTILMSDIARYDDMYFVTVPRENTKTNVENSFAIRGRMLERTADAIMSAINCGASTSFQSATVSHSSTSASSTIASGGSSSTIAAGAEASSTIAAGAVAGSTTAAGGCDNGAMADVNGSSPPYTQIYSANPLIGVVTVDTNSDEIACDAPSQSQQNFLGTMDQNLAFYKCQHITINFNKK